jgi:N-acetylmuramoyl-L-alanine amidase CwlA
MLESGKTPAKAPPKKIDTKTTDTKTTDSKTTNAKAPAKKTDPKTTPAKGEAGSPDERLEMLEIQRLVDKQNQMFTLVSNVMKNMHETTMVAIQNVR